MFDIILFTPQIPPNTGNIIRLCANTGARLHLIRPLGFTLDEKAVRRAGLDYHDMASVSTHDSLAECTAALGPTPIYAVTKFAARRYDDPAYDANCAFLFGAETTGLPADIHDSFEEDHKIQLPMLSGNRSLNLANAVSIVVYEAWRQCGFVNSVARPHPEDFA
jgi:tRNA (cytidine/uridine-2'-O-)-methyltransferase